MKILRNWNVYSIYVAVKHGDVMPNVERLVWVIPNKNIIDAVVICLTKHMLFLLYAKPWMLAGKEHLIVTRGPY